MERVFNTGGDVGALMREMDWGATPLGPSDGWPQSLRTAVSIILTSRYPMFLFWGPELVKIYNDGYRPITGAKHPWALGRPGREVWPEIWDTIGPMVDRVMNHGEATWSDDLMLFMERHGFPEEVYFTFSYSPIRDESGGIGGMFCACTETTAKVLSERRLSTLRDLAAAPAEANSAEDACTLSTAVLGESSADVPFSLLYLLEADGVRARLAGSSGVEPGHPFAPQLVSLGDEGGLPLARVATTREVVTVTGLAEGAPSGPWPEPPTTAVLLPLVAQGQDRAVGVLVLGVSSRRPFDGAYRDFFSLIGKQIATSLAKARALEEERRRLAALAELDRAKTVFFSNISHEFRTPLTLMLGPTENALSSPEPALRGVELETVHRNQLRLLKLVNTLLDFSRMEAGRMQAAFEPTELGRLTADLASAFRSAIERGGLRFEVDCASTPPVYVDRDMWEKIVFNLISNAFKYTLEGAIRVSLRAEERRIELRVEDTGVGIASEELPHLFERFRRIEGTRARTHEGSGIGLALVHELVKMHGGTIAVTSEVGRGSAFVVTIPTGTAHLPADRVGGQSEGARTAVRAESYVGEADRWSSARATNGASPSPDRRPRVLVADDNADMRDYIARLLGDRWDVEVAADGVQALAAVAERAPEVIVADIMMPNLDGLGLLRALRADARTAGIPFVLLSARAGEDARVEGLAAGADDYLVKPFSSQELRARIAVHIDRVRARADADAAGERLQSAIDAAGVGTWRFEVATGADARDARLNQILGLAAEPSTQGLDDFLARVHPDDRERVTAAWQPLLEGQGECAEVEHRIVRPDGRVRWVRDRGRTIRDDQGRLRYLTGAIVDVTEAKAAELRFRAMADAAPAILWVTEPDGRCTFLSRGWYEYTGQTEAEARGLGWTEAVHPEDRARARSLFLGANAAREPFAFDYRLRRADGVYRWAIDAGRPWSSPDGAFLGYVGSVIDIAERKEAEQRAIDANRAKDEFLAMLGHELRNPLSPILTATQLMRLRGHDGNELEVIERQVSHLGRLVDDLLDVSRITRGKVELRRERVEIARVVLKGVEIASPMLEQRRQRLNVQVPPEGLVVDGDPDRLAQVMSNLLTNAAKYSEPGSQIDLAAERVDGRVRLRVRDRGIGIAPDMLERVFDIFVQQPQALDRSKGGLGLGLSIVRSLVELHAGTVRAESGGQGQGSEFIVELPLADGGAGATDAPSLVRSPSPATPAVANKKRILAVDDNQDAAELLADLLAQLGHEVRVAFDGPTAVATAREWKPHVCVLDIGLPVMDGYEVARLMRTLDDMPRGLRLVALTGYGQDADRLRSVEAGFDIHVVKPVDLAVLGELVRD